MPDYLNLERRFSLLTKYTPEELVMAEALGRRRVPWNSVLKTRLSLIVARANFGKTTELRACAERLRQQDMFAVFLPLHRVLDATNLRHALDPADEASFVAWQQTPDKRLHLFVDSLDEAVLGRESGLRVALRTVMAAVGWPAADVRWVLSSRPATLTPAVLQTLQTELGVELHQGEKEDTEGEAEGEGEGEGAQVVAMQPELSSFGEAQPPAAASSTVIRRPKLKLFALLPLDGAAARYYLAEHHGVAAPKALLDAANQFGLSGLADGPGSLDVLAFIDLLTNPPRDLTDAFERMVEAVQAQQRSDSRENRVGNPPPENLTAAIERLAAASVLCQLPNIELSPDALGFREGVLSARPLAGSLLSQNALAYLLGSRLFVDSGHHQVKLYPDELLPFLAAKSLTALVQSPEDASRLVAGLTWRASTGECGVHRVYLTLAGWLATFNAHCRQELLTVEPQALTFFGDMRNPQIPLPEASAALTASIERFVNVGDVLGRNHFRPTTENYWQAGKPGIEPTLLALFEQYTDEPHSRQALLDIATHAAFDVLRTKVLELHGGDFVKLMQHSSDLAYILALGRDDDNLAIAQAAVTAPSVLEQVAYRVLTDLAWKTLDAKSIADVVSRQYAQGHGGFHVSWALTHDVADGADSSELLELTRSLLVHLLRHLRKSGPHGASRFEHNFTELAMDMIALVISRPGAPAEESARLVFSLHRAIKRFHIAGFDPEKLKAAMTDFAEVRRAFLRKVIASTDGTPNEIWMALHTFGGYDSWQHGDDVAIGEPGFTKLVAEMEEAQSRPKATPHPAPPRPVPELDEESKTQLLAVADSVRDGTNDHAIGWIAQWLSQTNRQSRYGECNFSAFEDQAGNDLAQAARAGLGALWRRRLPSFNESQPNSMPYITIAGLQGLSLELGDGTSLPSLSDAEVLQALSYARFEINGYPKWFWPVAAAYPQIALTQFREVLSSAAAGATSSNKADDLLRHLEKAPEEIQRALASDVWNYTTTAAPSSVYALESALTCAFSGTQSVDRADFEGVAWERIHAAYEDALPNPENAAGATPQALVQERQRLETTFKELTQSRANAVVWAMFWLWRFPDTFGAAWENWRLSEQRAAEELMFDLAGRLGEDRQSYLSDAAAQGSEGLKALAALYEWVISVVTFDKDTTHSDGRVYTMRIRDHAQQLRNALLPAIATAKSQAAYDVLEGLRLKATGDRQRHIRRFQFLMCEDAAASPPLEQRAYDRFERDLAPPVSNFISFAQAVHNDVLTVKRSVENGEFSLRRFFSAVNFSRIKTDNDGLALEEDFQALLGSELNHVCGDRYVVTLESILPESTRRDVLCQQKDYRATIELKMSERWTLDQYIVALELQLQGQYLKASNSKIGFFVVVLQRPRTWETPSGDVDFKGLLGILETKARELRAADSSLFLRIVGIDALQKEDFRVAVAAKKAASKAPPKFGDGTGNTWSGRGQKPKWLKAALAAGRSLEDFRLVS